MIYRCDLVPQYLNYKDLIDQKIKKVLESGKYILGEEVEQFEVEFSNYIGARYGLGVANGTDALILAMKALDITTGDEVITTPFTAIPTVSAIIAVGAKPVFVDIDPNTYLIDIKLIREKITEKTKAIIPVHLFGNVVDIEKLINEIGANIPVIEDACQAHGSMINGKKAGSLGTFGVFSFYPTKNLGAYGDGGMIVTNSEYYFEKLKLLRMYGMINYHTIKINGINSRLDEIQAAILRIKLKFLDTMNERRNILAKRYIDNLKQLNIEFQKIDTNVFSNYHIFNISIKEDRNSLIDFLEKAGIQTNIYYKIPIHLQEANRFLNYKEGSFPNAEALSKKILALPMYAEFQEEKQNKVIETIKNYFNKLWS